MDSTRCPSRIRGSRADRSALRGAEDNIASTKSRSLLAIGGRLLAEISLPKLAVAWVTLIGLPAKLLGLAPLVLLG